MEMTNNVFNHFMFAGQFKNSRPLLTRSAKQKLVEEYEQNQNKQKLSASDVEQSETDNDVEMDDNSEINDEFEIPGSKEDCQVTPGYTYKRLSEDKNVICGFDVQVLLIIIVVVAQNNSVQNAGN